MLRKFFERSESTGTGAGEPGTLSPVEKELDTLIRARYPLIYLSSYEEERVQECLENLCRLQGKTLICWSCVRGLVSAANLADSQSKSIAAGSQDPLQALGQVQEDRQAAVYLFYDLHAFWNDRKVVRKVRETARLLRSSAKTLILLAPVVDIPPELEKELTLIHYPLPDKEELGRLFDSMTAQVRKAGHLRELPEADVREKMISAARGLTRGEAENAWARTLILRGRLTEEEIQLVLEEKKQAIKKSGILEYIDTDRRLQDVGGMRSLKEWVRKRTVAFGEKAQAFGLPQPKGVLLLGVQGCGKSLCAQAISLVWNLPLLRLDVGRIFTGLIGSSEQNIRNAIALAESTAPCVLWVDEIEKAFAGTRQGQSDGGTSGRVFATFLTWLQEKQAPVFVVATANSLDQLPPELLRKGRFDEIFFVDLPSERERADIFAIHLKRRRRDPSAFDTGVLARLSQGYSGSEIEQAVIASLYDAFDQGRDLRQEDIVRSLAQQVPLAQTMREEIASSRRWAAGRARQASGEDCPEPSSDTGTVGFADPL